MAENFLKLQLERFKKPRAETSIEGKDREIYDAGQIGILKDLHDRIDAPATPQQVAIHYKGAKKTTVAEILQTLESFGLATEEGGRFIG